MKVLILCHGFLGFGSTGLLNFIPVTYFKNIASSINQGEIRVLEPTVAAIGTIAERADNLIDYIKTNTDENDQLYFIAHSMGGLDVSFAVPQLIGSRTVVAVTTIGTPYGGSEVADVIYDKTDSALTRAIPLLFRPFLDRLTQKALKELTTTESKKRNLLAGIPASIKYTLIASDIYNTNNATFLFDMAAAIGKINHQPNDGVVTVSSALSTLNPGNTNITLSNQLWSVDHIGQIGWFVDSEAHISRYHKIIEDMTGLHRAVFSRRD